VKYKAIDVSRVSGNAKKILMEEKVTGYLEFVPRPDGGGYLMLPVDVLIAKNDSIRGISEIIPLSKMDHVLRTILTLGKVEARKLLSMHSGNEMTIVRKGWGREWEHTIRKETE